jgi:trigger factor
MKSTVENTSTLGRKINVAVPVDAVRSAFDKVFQSIQKNAEIKGFRKGKVPMATIRTMYKDRVLGDVANDLINQFYFHALTEHKLEPVGNPELEFDDPTELKDFTFSANVEVRPEVKLTKYEGLDVVKEKFAVEDSAVDKVLENIRASRASLDTVLEDRPAQMGDTAILDFDGYVHGQPLAGGKGDGHSLELGSNSFIEGFEEGLVGMKIGAEKTLNLKFPTPYHSKDLEGKAVEFKVKLHELKKKVLPEMSDEFLKTLGGPADLDGLKKSIRDDIEKGEQKRIEDGFKNRMLKALVAANPVDVPQSLMKDQKASLIEDFKKRMQQQGMSEDEFTDYVSKWDKDFELTAKEMIQASFLVDEIARKHDLVCKKEDFDKKISDYAKQTGIEEARVLEFYSQREQMSRLTYTLTEDKVMAFLTSAAKIKMVDKKDLKEEEQ